MNWIESTRLVPIAAPGSLAANDAASRVESPQGGWNPYEVWLTRVRAPRAAEENRIVSLDSADFR